MGLDWERLSPSGYFEAIEAREEAEAGAQKPAISEITAARLDRFNRAHGVN